jgi:hypothetical protein
MPPHRILTIAILFLSAGGLGGSFQPGRLILIGGFALVFARFASRLGRSHQLEGSAVIFCLVTLLLGLLSISWTPDLSKGVGLWVTLAVGFLAFGVVISSEKTVQYARELRDAWSWSFLATVPLAVYEIWTDNHFLYSLEERNIGGDYGSFKFASAFFGNYNNYCVFICLALPMLFGTLDQSRTPRARAMWLTAIAAAYLILVVNTSRAALIAGFAIFLFYLVTRKATKVIGVVIASTISFGAAAFLLQDEIYRFASLLSLRARALIEGDESLEQRTELIKFGIERLSQTWGFGGGVGAFEGEVARWQYSLIPNAHNFLLELAVNFSIFALLAFCLFMIVLFRGAMRSVAPPDIRFAPLVGIPLLPLIGALNSQAIGYTYWWVWIATLLFMVVVGNQARHRATNRLLGAPVRSTTSR